MIEITKDNINGLIIYYLQNKDSSMKDQLVNYILNEYVDEPSEMLSKLKLFFLYKKTKEEDFNLYNSILNKVLMVYKFPLNNINRALKKNISNIDIVINFYIENSDDVDYIVILLIESIYSEINLNIKNILDKIQYNNLENIIYSVKLPEIKLIKKILKFIKKALDRHISSDLNIWNLLCILENINHKSIKNEIKNILDEIEESYILMYGDEIINRIDFAVKN